MNVHKAVACGGGGRRMTFAVHADGHGLVRRGDDRIQTACEVRRDTHVRAFDIVLISRESDQIVPRPELPGRHERRRDRQADVVMFADSEDRVGVRCVVAARTDEIAG